MRGESFVMVRLTAEDQQFPEISPPGSPSLKNKYGGNEWKRMKAKN